MRGANAGWGWALVECGEGEADGCEWHDKRAPMMWRRPGQSPVAVMVYEAFSSRLAHGSDGLETLSASWALCNGRRGAMTSLAMRGGGQDSRLCKAWRIPQRRHLHRFSTPGGAVYKLPMDATAPPNRLGSS